MSSLYFVLPIITMVTSYSIIQQLPKETLYTQSPITMTQKPSKTDVSMLPTTARSSIRKTSVSPTQLKTRASSPELPELSSNKTTTFSLETSTSLIEPTSTQLQASTKQRVSRCFDQYMNCHGVKHLCRDAAYSKLMLQSCAKTCSLCKDFIRLPLEERCIDKHLDECPTWAENGFCRSTFYTFEEKMEKCMRTCKLC